MLLSNLTVVNYKNLEQIELSFSSKINCLIGNNGMGKTNLLDAIYYLSFCKSFTNPVDIQNIHHAHDFFVIQGIYQRIEGEDTVVYCGLKRRQKKQFKLNKKEYERLSDHIGYLPLVVISPFDSSLISEGSEERRRFVDSVISQYNKLYLIDLIRYNKALMQRNSLIKNNLMQDDLVIDILEEQMAQAAEVIFNARKAFIDEFVPLFEKRFNEITAASEHVLLKYQSQLFSNNLLSALRESREKDKILGYTTVGIHRDDLEMLLDDFPIKRIGSQGQNKSFLIALKLAQYDIVKQSSQLKPMLLLDDLFDKLDAQRVERLVRLVGGNDFGQIFITDTNRDHLIEILKNTNLEVSYFFVDNGTVVRY
ncbi:DNA replication/repair protein RecF [Microbacter margulisiae]|nr:DNA replication and repair protein RecF [Microbacter margulisiae]